MKSRFAKTASLVFFLAVVSFSQISVRPGIVAGIDFMNYSVNSSIATSENAPTGVTLGGICEIQILHLLSIQPGIVYTERGSSIAAADNLAGDVIATRYLAIPVDVKIKYPVLPLLSAYIFGGVNTSFLLNTQVTARSAVAGIFSPNPSFIDNPDFHTIDFGLDLGVGVELPLVLIVPYAEFNYYLGLANIDKNSGKDGTTLKNRGGALLAGIKFKI